MPDQDLRNELGQWLQRQLEQGIVVGGEVVDYLEATFGTRDLAAVLADEDSSEVDSLLELLFYPDAGLQLKFEGQWGRQTIAESDRDAIIDALCAKSPIAQLELPETGSPLTLAVPDFVCQTFVHRLNMCQTLHPKLANLLDDRPMGEANLLPRVQLRNARLAWHDDQVAMLELFLNKMPAQNKSITSDLQFLISILPEMATGDDPYTFLTGKKFFYFKALCSAEDFERKRTASNMEIMMMSGARSAHGSIEEWRDLMRSIDRICQALFGRTEFFQQPDNQTFDLQESRDLQDVVRKLS